MPEEDRRSSGKGRRESAVYLTTARVQIHLRLSDEEKQGATKTFFTKVKEELDIIPAQARVLEYWQEKAVFEYGWRAANQGSPAPGSPFGQV